MFSCAIRNENSVAFVMMYSSIADSAADVSSTFGVFDSGMSL